MNSRPEGDYPPPRALLGRSALATLEAPLPPPLRRTGPELSPWRRKLQQLR